MSGRHRDKSIIALAYPGEDMSYLPGGHLVGICLNPTGMSSCMSIGQALELHLDITTKQLGVHTVTPVFGSTSEGDIWNMVRKTGIGRDSKTVLYNDRIGEPFHNCASVGITYYLKLTHMADDKIHTRSIGPHSLVT